MRRFAVVFEKAESNWAAYVPDLPGCITTGPTLQQTKHNIREAIELHLEAMLEAGEPIPRTHDLPKLLDLIIPNQPGLRGLRRGLRFLKNFAVDIRYPGFNTSARQASSSLRWAHRVRSEIRTVLGLDT